MKRVTVAPRGAKAAPSDPDQFRRGSLACDLDKIARLAESIHAQAKLLGFDLLGQMVSQDTVTRARRAARYVRENLPLANPSEEPPRPAPEPDKPARRNAVKKPSDAA
jgi:hypothetical protein